jgi:hypothetical protein
LDFGFWLADFKPKSAIQNPKWDQAATFLPALAALSFLVRRLRLRAAAFLWMVPLAAVRSRRWTAALRA